MAWAKAANDHVFNKPKLRGCAWRDRIVGPLEEEKVLAELVEDVLSLTSMAEDDVADFDDVQDDDEGKFDEAAANKGGAQAFAGPGTPLASRSAQDRLRCGTASTQAGQELIRLWVLRCVASGEHDSSSV